MKNWRYKGIDPAVLKEVYSVGEEAPATATEPAKVPRLMAIHVELVPGEVFSAPDDWAPVPNPHPLFEVVAGKKATATAKEIAAIDPADQPS